MPTWARWAVSLAIVAAVLGVPALAYRSGYTNQKRFRVVTPGKFYRGGQFTAGGFRDAVRKAGLKCVVNLQEENQDPFMPEEWLAKPSIRESELCRQLGVKYVPLFGGEMLDRADSLAGKRPPVIDEFLKLCDDPANYPMMIHCKAGLHRTGRLTAVYRMEYEGWTPAAAMQELKANGYGHYMASTADEYINQYVGRYTPGVRCPVVPNRPIPVPAGREP